MSTPTKSMCEGCRNNFYNGNNDLGVKECWSFKTATVCTRFRLSIHTPMNIREAYKKRKTLNCFSEKGFVHLTGIPHYATLGGK